MRVFVLLYCRSDDNLQGNLLFFESIRVGFPDAEIHVFDNNNPHAYCEQFAHETERIKGTFTMLSREILHSQFIESLAKKEDEDFYVVDPDTIWFDRMPKSYDAPLAGRLIPAFFDSFTGCHTLSRLHTSCLFLSPAAIRSHLSGLRNKFAFNGFRDVIFKHNGKWFRYDTCGQLYHALQDAAHVYDDQENSAFAHLFCGTHLDLMRQYYPRLAEIHDLVAKGERDLQWLYHEQNNFFNSLGSSL